MAALSAIVEGVATAAIKYFLDPKEPVLDLRPMSGEHINAPFVREVVESTLRGKKMGCKLRGDDLFLYRTTDRRMVIDFSQVGQHSSRRESLPSTHKLDDIHRKNVSLLWNYNNEYRNYRAHQMYDNLNSYATLIMALCETNRVRLADLLITTTGEYIYADAILMGPEDGWNNVFRLQLCTDNAAWDLADHGPVHDTTSDYLTFVQYDGYGRPMTIAKRDSLALEKVICEVRIDYMETMPLALTTTTIAHKTVIPRPVFERLGISRIVKENVSIVNNGTRFYEYDCLNRDGQTVLITVKH